jgi:glutamate---cysteine ligase / carboxylate-amine ligase
MQFDTSFLHRRGYLISGSHPFRTVLNAAARDDGFSFGIEEEFFLVDAGTMQVADETPEDLFETADARGQGRITREFLQAHAGFTGRRKH